MATNQTPHKLLRETESVISGKIGDLMAVVKDGVQGMVPDFADYAGLSTRVLVEQLNAVSPQQREAFLQRYTEELAAEWNLLDPNGDKHISSEEMLAVVTDPETIKQAIEIGTHRDVISDTLYLSPLAQSDVVDVLQSARMALAASCAIDPDQLNTALKGGNLKVEYPAVYDKEGALQFDAKIYSYDMTGAEEILNEVLAEVKAKGPSAVNVGAFAAKVSPSFATAMNFGGAAMLRQTASEVADELGLDREIATDAADRLVEHLKQTPDLSPEMIDLVADVAHAEIKAAPESVELPTAQQLCAAGTIHPNPIAQAVDELRAIEYEGEPYGGHETTYTPNIPPSVGGGKIER